MVSRRVGVHSWMPSAPLGSGVGRLGYATIGRCSHPRVILRGDSVRRAEGAWLTVSFGGSAAHGVVPRERSDRGIALLPRQLFFSTRNNAMIWPDLRADDQGEKNRPDRTSQLCVARFA